VVIDETQVRHEDGVSKEKLPKDNQSEPHEPHEQETWDIKTNGQNVSSKQRVCKVLMLCLDVNKYILLLNNGYDDFLWPALCKK
jgi:hypothetical protein